MRDILEKPFHVATCHSRLRSGIQAFLLDFEEQDERFAWAPAYARATTTSGVILNSFQDLFNTPSQWT